MERLGEPEKRILIPILLWRIIKKGIDIPYEAQFGFTSHFFPNSTFEPERIIS